MTWASLEGERMMSTVKVNPAIFHNAFWTLGKLRTDMATWGLLCPDDRKSLDYAVQKIRAEFSPYSYMTKPFEIEVERLKELRGLFTKLGAGIYSARNVMTDDRRRALGMVKRITLDIDSYIQLNLFG